MCCIVPPIMNFPKEYGHGDQHPKRLYFCIQLHIERRRFLLTKHNDNLSGASLKEKLEK